MDFEVLEYREWATFEWNCSSCQSTTKYTFYWHDYKFMINRGIDLCIECAKRFDIMLQLAE